MPTSRLGGKSAPQTCCQVWCNLVQKKALTIERKGLFLLVPRDRIELPTRGFSVLRHCVYFQHVTSCAHQIVWCKPLFHTSIHTPPHPTSPGSGHSSTASTQARQATPASRAATAYEVARICTTGGNGPCPPAWPQPYLSPCVANPSRQICLTAMPGSTEFHLASRKKPRLTSDPVLSVNISNSLSFKHPAPASRPQY